eukprot:COSAG04_NODE_20959_length_382_cov_1.106007_1_plen_26_part_10
MSWRILREQVKNQKEKADEEGFEKLW